MFIATIPFKKHNVSALIIDSKCNQTQRQLLPQICKIWKLAFQIKFLEYFMVQSSLVGLYWRITMSPPCCVSPSYCHSNFIFLSVHRSRYVIRLLLHLGCPEEPGFLVKHESILSIINQIHTSFPKWELQLQQLLKISYQYLFSIARFKQWSYSKRRATKLPNF